MASELAQQKEPNTPWWYETPSLVSQTTHLSAFASSADSTPFDVTPSVSSGYYDEDDSSNVSEGSYGGRTAHGHTSLISPCLRTDSNWSNSTITEGRSTNIFNNGSLGTESTNTLVEGGIAESSAFYLVNSDTTKDVNEKEACSDMVEQQNERVDPTSAGERGEGGLVTITAGQFRRDVRGRRIEVDRDHRSGDQVPIIKAFEKGKEDHSPRYLKKNYESGPGTLDLKGDCTEGNLLTHSKSAINQEILHYLAPLLLQNICPLDLLPHMKHFELLSDDDIDFIYNPKNSKKEKIIRIILNAPSKDINALDCFVECLEADITNKSHIYLAKRFREAIEKKRLHPFKQMSSLRNKGHTHIAHVPLRHKAHMAMSTFHMDSMFTNGKVPPSSSSSIDIDRIKEPLQDPLMLRRQSVDRRTPPSIKRHQQLIEEASYRSNIRSQSVDTLPFCELRDATTDAVASILMRNTESKMSLKLGGHQPLNYVPEPGNFFSLPRNRSQSCSSESTPRGTKQYSSARYPKSMPPIVHGKSIYSSERCPKLSLSRNSSFRDMDDGNVSVPPLDRNPMIETEDGGYFRKAPTGNIRASNYRNTSSPVMGAVPAMPFPLNIHSSRMHDIILEDPSHSNVTSGKEVPEPDSTRGGMTDLPVPIFPRNIPGRSHSLHIPGDYHGRDRKTSLLCPLEIGRTIMMREKSSCLRRGASLRCHMDCLPRVSLASVISSFSQQSEKAHQAEVDGSDLCPHQRNYEPANIRPTSGGVLPKVIATHPAEGTLLPGGTSQGTEAVTCVDVTQQDINQKKMTKKKMQWLQLKIKFKQVTEEVLFDSLTHLHIPRDIIFSGTLYEKKSSRFVILLTDMLLVLKAKKRGGKFGVKSRSHHQFIDWFTEVDCKAREPLMLHLLSIQENSLRTNSECFVLHYNKGSSLVKVRLHAVSKAARDIWVDNLFAAIRACTTANAKHVLPVKYSVNPLANQSPTTTLNLTIREANNIASSTNTTTKNHYCIIRLGPYKCRTPSVKAKCWPTWNYKCKFYDFQLQDILRIDFFTERISCPDDFLGFVDINLYSATQKHQTKLGLTEMQLRNQHLPLKEGKGILTVDFELKWDQAEQ